MNAKSLRDLFAKVRQGKISTDEAVQRLRHLPFEDLGFAKLDHHRALRQGMPEVIFSEGKSPAHLAKIFVRLAAHGGNILATRATEEQFKAVEEVFLPPSSSKVVIPSEEGNPKSSPAENGRNLPRVPHVGSPQTARFSPAVVKVSRFSKRGINPPKPEYRPLARAITLHRDRKLYGQGVIAVISAGTSDIPVAEEAVVTAELMGNRVQHLYDVGVAGIHRLLAHQSVLAKARVIIVCAGMEGALPSVVGGLVGVPVIAVPTSVGYGAAFEGLAALLGMLNSCASNVSVVNIDNGFGAAYVASLINRS